MKKFLIQTVVFTALLTAGMLLVFFMANGNSDAYYLRFTSGQQGSMILGSSRAAQGLQPPVFNNILYKNTSKHFYNYSFSNLDSPFGPAYYESIKTKLDPGTKEGIFIITVDPWSISDTSSDPDDENSFAENNGFIGKTKCVNLDPNIPYLVRSYNEPYINILRKWKKATAFKLHTDGWLQLDVNMDSAAVAGRTTEKIAFYRKHYLPHYKFSNTRLNYLIKTINLLQQHGRVYLVRLPVARAMFDVENELMPGFDDRMQEVAAEKNLHYLSFARVKNEYQYVDGHHLYQRSGKEVSAFIAAWILQKSR